MTTNQIDLSAERNFRSNCRWLKKQPGVSTYLFWGTIVCFHSNDHGVHILLAQRFGCFFTDRNRRSHFRITIIRNRDGTFNLQRHDGEWVACEHLGEVLFPHIAHMFDALFASMGTMLTFHAAAVACKNHGVLIAGTSNAGKTTTALGLAGRGYSYLSDDVSLIRYSGTGTEYTLCGNPAGIKQRRIGPEHISTGLIAETYTNPCEIPVLEIVSSVPLSAVVLITGRSVERCGIHDADYRLYLDRVNALLIPPVMRVQRKKAIPAMLAKVAFGVARTQHEGTREAFIDAVDQWVSATFRCAV
jgi:hypothetical protein